VRIYAGERVVPFGKFVANTLKEWKLACPKSELDLMFPTAPARLKALQTSSIEG
jgi:integrase